MLYTEFYSGHGIFRSFNSVYEEGGKRVGIRERNESWKKELNLDIRPYLKEGIILYGHVQLLVVTVRMH